METKQVEVRLLETNLTFDTEEILEAIRLYIAQNYEIPDDVELEMIISSSDDDTKLIAQEDIISMSLYWRKPIPHSLSEL